MPEICRQTNPLKWVTAARALDGWTVCWLNGTVDIAPEHLYEMSVAA